jgi:hypothetical protein
MDSKYGTVEIVHDATTFAASRFGQHYLDRLKTKKDDALNAAMNLSYTDSFRSHSATVAKSVQDELDYFDAVQRIKNKPALMKTLADRLKVKRGEAE